jgi:hypothetical protein
MDRTLHLLLDTANAEAICFAWLVFSHGWNFLSQLVSHSAVMANAFG